MGEGSRQRRQDADDKEAEEELEEDAEEEEDSLSQSGLNLGESAQADLLEGSKEACTLA